LKNPDHGHIQKPAIAKRDAELRLLLVVKLQDH